ncbi:hypothetical protein SSABA_v1c08910 [Spiroplasma sabaudiense Ar-1343]|uniref:Uncharacterized protein n=1 Tax=Spiroplasma sabaudiense Ar-1343 TaxID=1276257 RepID=W6ABS7_9MOLU|nr:hypothetical protein [Spiroplasma sabaudiense]AHI54290.1 hypothetical protein SSABA_v1c08910 [Spiroplasma sabaudiense Ar-1343]
MLEGIQFTIALAIGMVVFITSYFLANKFITRSKIGIILFGTIGMITVFLIAVALFMLWEDNVYTKTITAVLFAMYIGVFLNLVSNRSQRKRHGSSKTPITID